MLERNPSLSFLQEERRQVSNKLTWFREWDVKGENSYLTALLRSTHRAVIHSDPQGGLIFVVEFDEGPADGVAHWVGIPHFYHEGLSSIFAALDWAEMYYQLLEARGQLPKE